ncbi:Lactosylceramide 1,3-N-acetyl-beta-D-glucosaminyltransferase [Lamellibrachia satsuma]|nr:Lactosylceramide 1,3-N-acetyl-beta-D-glucosaminyltransferase [Lamellibrachia satsuma]
MLPRRSSITRVLTATLLVGMGLWLLVSGLLGSTSSIVTQFVTLDTTVSSSSRQVTLTQLQSVRTKVQKLTHRHSNLTLEKIQSNMTLMKVNMSGLQNIIHSANKSQHSVERLPLNVANPHPFRYLLNTQHACDDKDIFVLVYVHTAPSHHKRRSVIRQTWGSRKYYTEKIKVVFVMGRTNDGLEVQNALEYESDVYRDIVQEDFLDSYHNLTYKGIAALKWVSNFCGHAKFVLKTDDDIFVNMFTLLRHLKSLYNLKTNSQGLLMCLVWYRMKVMRTGKWKVPKSEFKDDYYPTYCSGSAYIMSVDVAIAMHRVSYDVPFFWVDDFYITGLLPLKAGNIKHKQFMSTYVLDGTKLREKFTGPQWYSYIFSHVHDLDAVQAVWSELVKLAGGLIVPDIKYAYAGQLPKVEKKILP